MVKKCKIHRKLTYKFTKKVKIGRSKYALLYAFSKDQNKKYKENSLHILEKRWTVADNKVQFDENSAKFRFLQIYKWVFFVFFISKE